ncbi:hypothetical protein CYFUS_001318 [Cystobacter fuscus]|uniref:Uncharacterized protein n=1 Tax=Cystobacter fuscus TaxID=43 RepID=A0A250IVY7_9BACT|nr:hypothetical protein CYFUS_001318 [Cystobacter fuscus]
MSRRTGFQPRRVRLRECAQPRFLDLGQHVEVDRPPAQFGPAALVERAAARRIDPRAHRPEHLVRLLHRQAAGRNAWIPGHGLGDPPPWYFSTGGVIEGPGRATLDRQRVQPCEVVVVYARIDRQARADVTSRSGRRDGAIDSHHLAIVAGAPDRWRAHHHAAHTRLRRGSYDALGLHSPNQERRRLERIVLGERVRDPVASGVFHEHAASGRKDKRLAHPCQRLAQLFHAAGRDPRPGRPGGYGRDRAAGRGRGRIADGAAGVPGAYTTATVAARKHGHVIRPGGHSKFAMRVDKHRLA